MVAAESLAVGAVGGGLGVVFGLLQHRVGAVAAGRLTGFSVQYRFVLAPVVLSVAAAVLVILSGALAPAWRAGRLDVVSAIGYE